MHSLTASDFDDSAKKLRRARDADDPDDFNDNLRRAVGYFNDALDAVNACASGRRSNMP
jgi:hypothetical protein